MRVKQWRYFWGRAFLCGGLLSGFCFFLLLIAPTGYVSRLVFEPVELYAGEDLSLPVPPRGISIDAQSPAELVRIRSVDRDPQVAATAAKTFVDDWSQQRLKQARSALLAAQAELEADSAAARRLEIQRKTLGTTGHVHARAEVSSFPISPNSDFILGGGLVVSAVLSLVLASLLTRWRGPKNADGEDISWSHIGARYWKVSAVLCPIFLLFSGALFLLQPRAYESVTSVRFLPEDPASFEKKLAVLGSRSTVARAVKKNRSELLQMRQYWTEKQAVDRLIPSLEVSGEPGSSSATIRFSSNHSELTNLIPAEIVRAFADRESLRLRDARGQKIHDLRAMSDAGQSDPELVAELNQMIDDLSQATIEQDTIEITALGASEKVAKGWIQWLAGHAWVGLLRGCVWAGVLTAVSFIGISRQVRTASPAVTAGPAGRSTIDQALPDPY